MIKVLETKKVNLKFSDLEPGEVFIYDFCPHITLRGFKAFSLFSINVYPLNLNLRVTEIVTKYEYTHDKK